MCSIHIDEPATDINYCVVIMSLCTFFYNFFLFPLNSLTTLSKIFICHVLNEYVIVD
jgi:hypothetical protein